MSFINTLLRVLFFFFFFRFLKDLYVSKHFYYELYFYIFFFISNHVKRQETKPLFEYDK